MATIGQVLATPESGWRRYDGIDSRFNYKGTWSSGTQNDWYNGTYKTTATVNSSVTFKFYGTKLRLIASCDATYSSNVTITIDGVSELYSSTVGALRYKWLAYEKVGLSLEVHEVVVKLNNSSPLGFDAIDIDDTGRLIHAYLTEKPSIESMEIGDAIPCRYQASRGAIGTFSELGTANMAEIPVGGSATPNGLFYFIKVDKGLLIADRPIQHSISWNTLNAGGYIEGKNVNLGDQNVLIRSLTIGVTYANNAEQTEPSLTEKGYGAYPKDNEWDRYIMNSSLGGKITPGSNNIWNISREVWTWSRNLPVIGFTNIDNHYVAKNTNRIVYVTNAGSKRYSFGSTESSNFVGFKPALEYIEPDGSTKQKTFWY